MARTKVTFDFGELQKWGEDLIRSVPEARAQTKAAMREAGKTITADARRSIRSQTRGIYTKHYPNALGYRTARSGLAVDVGPQKGRKQAFLFKILEYGTATSPPKPHLNPAVNKQLPILTGVIARVAQRALTEGNRGGR